ncbi:hypothetical protein AD945_01355 [Gluconobacter albidus]|uniref:Uncharacterized protein n=1 Tax=Gluconobacter albidus TaxID=318683 RepID=A0A149TN36_9PROT|nr:hypothetical protein [Gluconobacter albidus]KXV50776.1 hypothetical protein AD945_01355 [Gluconobacter albidus]
MAGVSGEVMLGALKKVLQRDNEDSWVLRPNFGVVAAKDLKDFINTNIHYGELEASNVKKWIELATKDLIAQRVKEKSVGLDAYEKFVMERDAEASLSDIPRLVERIYDFIFLSGH